MLEQFLQMVFQQFVIRAKSFLNQSTNLQFLKLCIFLDTERIAYEETLLVIVFRYLRVTKTKKRLGDKEQKTGLKCI